MIILAEDKIMDNIKIYKKVIKISLVINIILFIIMIYKLVIYLKMIENIIR